MRVERIANTIFSSNTFLISKQGFSDVWLVDCGDVDAILSVLKPEQIVKGVLLTHSHFDHIYGLNDLIFHFPECLIYTTKSGKDALYSDKLNFSKYHEASFILKSDNVQVLNTDSILVFENEIVSIANTPGHDPSCLTFRIGDYLYTGDAYIPGIKTVTNLRGGNKLQSETSRTLIDDLMKLVSFICPGHGDIVSTKSLMGR